MWEHEYVCDPKYYSYLVDAKEKPDGGIVFVGEAKTDTLPAWHQQEVWLLVTDSNGCEVPGCSGLAAPNLAKEAEVLRVYPNPFTNEITIANATTLLQQHTMTGSLPMCWVAWFSPQLSPNKTKPSTLPTCRGACIT